MEKRMYSDGHILNIDRKSIIQAQKAIMCQPSKIILVIWDMINAGAYVCSPLF